MAASVQRELKTKAGPLLLEGRLEVGYTRLADIRKGVRQRECGASAAECAKRGRLKV